MLGDVVGAFLGREGYKEASKRARRNLLAAVAHHDREIRKRERLIDLPVAERTLAEHRESRLFPPDR